MKLPYWIISIILMATCSVEAQPIVDPTEFAAAHEQAKADNEKDGDGCYMDCDFDPYFGERFHTVMRTCFKQLESPEVITFTTVLNLNSDGQVQKLWLDRDTNLSRCAVAAIKAIQFPKPPFAPFNARITVNLE